MRVRGLTRPSRRSSAADSAYSSLFLLLFAFGIGFSE